MKSLFLICEPLREYGGITMKILAQENALKRLGCQVVLSALKTNQNKFIGRYIGEETIDKYSNINFIGKIQSRIKYGNLYQYIVTNKIELVYIRYGHFANPFFIKFLKKLKRSNIKILLEIPTYPYDQEYKNLKITNEVLMWIEKLSRKKFKDLVSHIITFTPETKIFGVPAIEISNGIEVSSIKIAEQRVPDNAIHLIGVASIAYWHGYDRVIEGIHNYYIQNTDRRKIYFHIVGNTEDGESMRYHDLVNEYNLGNYVRFHGKKFGKELDILFNDADIAVGCLGCHRKGMEYSKSLKNREYCARGIPFFYSETDEPFENQNFIFKVPADESPIDIIEIMKFYDGNKFERNNIRNYAFRNLSWDKQFEKVIKNVFPKSFKSILIKIDSFSD